MSALIYKTLKNTIGFGLAVGLAMALGLSVPVSAGLITVLNMLDNKRDSARVAWRRTYSSVIGLAVAFGLFELIGYHPLVLALFLLVFSPLAVSIGAKEGIVSSTVLASHLLSFGQFSWPLFANEVLLVLIGAGMSLLLSLHMPDREKPLKEAQAHVEKQLRALLWTMSYNMRNLCTIHDEAPNLLDLERDIKKAKRLAYDYMNDFFIKDNPYYMEYFQMRLVQLYRLMYMREHLDMIFVDQGDAMTLSEFTGRLAFEFDEKNDGQALLLRLEEIKDTFKNAPLPTSRLEFENRAALFQYLNDLDEFIQIKARFYERQFGDPTG